MSLASLCKMMFDLIFNLPDDRKKESKDQNLVFLVK